MLTLLFRVAVVVGVSDLWPHRRGVCLGPLIRDSRFDISYRQLLEWKNHSSNSLMLLLLLLLRK